MGLRMCGWEFGVCVCVCVSVSGCWQAWVDPLRTENTHVRQMEHTERSFPGSLEDAEVLGEEAGTVWVGLD